MSQQPLHRKTAAMVKTPVVVAVVTAVVIVGGVAGALALAGSSASGATHRSAASGGGSRSGSSSGGSPATSTPAPSTTVTIPPVPLKVQGSTPASGASQVAGTQAISFVTTAKVDLAASQPTLSPAVAGQWSATANRLTFTPAGAFPPQTKVTVTLPSTLRTTQGASLGTAQSVAFTTAYGSALRLQQMLAMLGYLPLHWTPAGATVPAATAAALSPAAQQQAVYTPPAGTFAWTWPSVPATLSAQWTPGALGPMTSGAVMAFESDHQLTTDGIAGQQVWAALLAATGSVTPTANPHGYTYALATKTLPETLTVWHNGTLISQSGTNTGIPQAPTADGTFPVYERLATQVMRGTNPNGTKYADPVAWVAYFNGGDAVHYIPRASYGSPQSLGCLEVAYNVGQTVWPYLSLGSLVTVTG